MKFFFNDTATSGIDTLVCLVFFNDAATTEIYTLSLHDALPIYHRDRVVELGGDVEQSVLRADHGDRKSTRLNSSHLVISYAVFCLKKTPHRRGRPSGAPQAQTSDDPIPAPASPVSARSAQLPRVCRCCLFFLDAMRAPRFPLFFPTPRSPY